MAVSRRCLALASVAFLLLPIFGIAGASAQEDGAGEVAVQDVQERNDLIAAQESLLNVYRCRFNVDTQVVPDGCVDGKPAGGPTEPDLFEATPTENDLAVRDSLIQAQESLLNNYRCLFRIDMAIVPGGCHRLAVAASGAIWTMHGDGTDLVELVAKPDSEDRNISTSINDVSWSPDGKRIAYSLTYSNQTLQGNPVRGQIWTISSDGHDHILAHDTGERSYAYVDQITWSPDGSRLYYVLHFCCEAPSTIATSQLWTIDVDSANPKNLDYAGFYSWSPDRSQIVYRKPVDFISSDGESSRTSQMWIMDANGRSQRKIRDDASSFGPVWSPDGSSIAVEIILVDEDGDHSKELSVFNTEGRHRRLLDDIPYELAHVNDSRPVGLSWSPTGDQIVYLDYKDDEDVLTLIGVDGSGKQPLISRGRATTFPAWSLDGTRIAFARGTAEPFEGGNTYTGGGLWTVNPDGTNLHRLTPENWHISEIAWSPTR